MTSAVLGYVFQSPKAAFNGTERSVVRSGTFMLLLGISWRYQYQWWPLRNFISWLRLLAALVTAGGGHLHGGGGRPPRLGACR